MQRAGCGERTLWACLSPSIVLNTDWTATLFAVSGWASKREFVGSCFWEMQGHILLPAQLDPGPEDAIRLSLFLDGYSSLTCQLYPQASSIYVGPRQPWPSLLCPSHSHKSFRIYFYLSCIVSHTQSWTKFCDSDCRDQGHSPISEWVGKGTGIRKGDLDGV